MMHARLRNLIYGAGMAVGALALAWFINTLFERSWSAIALFLLAMLIAVLLQRMVAGAIPHNTPLEARSDETAGDHRPGIHEETAHLTGIDHRYGWMALPPALTLIAVLISMFV